MSVVHKYSETLYDINGLTNREFLIIRQSLQFTLDSYKKGVNPVDGEQVAVVSRLIEEIVVR